MNKVNHLRRRLLLIVAGTPLLIIISVLLFVGFHYITTYREGYWQQAEIIAHQFRVVIREYSFDNLPEEERVLVETLVHDFMPYPTSARNQIYDFIAVINKDGKILYHSNLDLIGTSEKLLTNLDETTIYRGQEDTHLRDPLWVTKRKIAGERYYLASTPLDGYDAMLSRTLIVIAIRARVIDLPFMRFLLTMLIVGLFASVIIPFLLNKSVLKPMFSMTKRMAQVLSGDSCPQINKNHEDDSVLFRKEGKQKVMLINTSGGARSNKQHVLINQMLQTASNPDAPLGEILEKISAILSQGLDMGVVIGSLPLPDLPVVHPIASASPEGVPLTFIREDITLEKNDVQPYREVSQASIISIKPLVDETKAHDREKLQQSVNRTMDNSYQLDQTLFIPLPGGGIETRFIAFVPRHAGPSIDDEMRELAISLASQTAVIMDNLNLSEETRRRSEELRLLYQSSLQLGELLTPDDVLTAIAELAVELLGGDASHLWIYHQVPKSLVLTYIHQGGTDSKLGKCLPLDEGLVGKSIKAQKTLSIGDYAIWEGRVDGLISSQYHAMLAIPLLGRAGPLGTVVCLSRRIAAFGEREINLADLFSAQAAAALENAYLNQEAQKRAEELSRLYDAGIDLISIRDVGMLLTRTVEWALRIIPTDRAVIYLEENEAHHFLFEQKTLNVGYVLEEEDDRYIRGLLIEKICQTKKSLSIPDVREDEGLQESKLIEKELLSLIGVPLQIGDSIVGSLFVYSSRAYHFTERDIDLLEFLVTQVSAALQASIQFEQTERALVVVGRQARYQTNVSQAVALLTENGTASINEVLHLLGEASEAPVALYFDVQCNGDSVYWKLHSWWSAEASLAKWVTGTLSQQVDVYDHQAWLDMLSDQISITGFFEDLPEDILNLSGCNACNMLIALSVQGAVEFPGFILILRKSRRLWDEQEVVALQTVAAALSSTMAKEQLFSQVQQTLSETEALYRGSAALSESNTYKSILDVLLTHTVLGKGSADVSLQLFSNMWSETTIPEYAEVVAYWSNEEWNHIRERFYIKDFPSSIDIIRNGVPLFIEEVARDENLDRRARAMFHKALGAESVILVPLVVGGQRVGYIHATYPERQNFSEQAKRQLTNLVQQAAVAVLNIQQLRATEARVRREQLIRQITGRIQQAPDVEGVLQTAIRELGRTYSTSRNRIQFHLPKQVSSDE